MNPDEKWFRIACGTNQLIPSGLVSFTFICLTSANASPRLTVPRMVQRCGTPPRSHQNHHGGVDLPDPCKNQN